MTAEPNKIYEEGEEKKLKWRQSRTGSIRREEWKSLGKHENESGKVRRQHEDTRDQFF